jgi:fructose-bisphosphate aldolase class I
MDVVKLNEIAKQMVAKGKGILAADESTGTMTKRLDSIGVESTEENRRKYRQWLLSSPGMEEYISGVILYDETLRQKTDTGDSFATMLLNKGVLPGIKVDMGAKDLSNFPGEKVTEGLDGLRERFAEYAKLGAAFSKWRAVINIGEGIPTDFSLMANAHALARFAALSQEAGIVPIVEPEVLMDGNHSLERCHEVTSQTLKVVFEQLLAHKVEISGMILKPNMVVSGSEHQPMATPQEVAEATVSCFKASLPADLPGAVFLSGGLSPDEATERLLAINQKPDLPWELSYSFGRALQAEALETWAGKDEQGEAMQKAFLARAQKVSLARQGKD